MKKENEKTKNLKSIRHSGPQATPSGGPVRDERSEQLVSESTGMIFHNKALKSTGFLLSLRSAGMTHYGCQCGRSMVEMLGTLAIMGILSVGGIRAYTMLMNKHKVNTILDGLQKRAVAIATKQGFMGDEAANLLEFEGQDLEGFNVSLYSTPIMGSDFAIQITGVDKNLCEQIKQAGIMNAVSVKPDTCDTTNTMIFAFKNELNRKDMSSGTGEFTSEDPGWLISGEACDAEKELRCNDIVLESCEKHVDGKLHWTQKEICGDYGCYNNACEKQECSPNGLQRCWDQQFIKICENGKWKESDPSWVFNGQHTRFKPCKWGCKNDACQEECSTAGQKACLSETIDGVDYWTVLTCTSDGIWDYAKTGIRSLVCRKDEYSTCESCYTF